MLYSAKLLVEHGVSNIRQIRRFWFSSDAKSHLQVIEVVEEPQHFLTTACAAYSASKAIQAFFFDPNCIMVW